MMDIIERLNDKDDKAAYEFAKQIVSESTKSDKYLDLIPVFAEMLKAKSSFIRTRAFILICNQARWANDGQIDVIFDQMLSVLNDPKPTVVRQCLAALHEVVMFRPEMSEQIEKAVSEIGFDKYKDSMSQLIKKDIDNLMKLSIPKVNEH